MRKQKNNKGINLHAGYVRGLITKNRSLDVMMNKMMGELGQAGFLDDNSLGKKTHQTFHKMRELIEYIKQLTHTNESK